MPIKIEGQLRDDIMNGKVVLFLGAGASQAAGLKGAIQLTNYLFDLAGRPTAYAAYKNDLMKLVAKVDRDPLYTRKWINAKIVDYFLDAKNYVNLSNHEKLFLLNWAAIFTTNYDICLELAEQRVHSKKFRLLPLADPKEVLLINNLDPGKLKYFKIHGCCRELESHPGTAAPLVLTQRDYQDSISRNRPFLEEFKRLAYDCSIIFIGFQAQKIENNYIFGALNDAYLSISNLIGQPFRPFALLKDTDNEMRTDLEEIGVRLLEGSFEDFLDEAMKIKVTKEHGATSHIIEEKIYISAGSSQVALARAEYMQLLPFFNCYYDGFIEEELVKSQALQPSQIVDIWKSEPHEVFIASNRYIERNQYQAATIELNEIFQEVVDNKAPQVFIIEGNRASGKSVMVRQLAHYAYTVLRQPTLLLTPDASYFDRPHGSPQDINISGWDNRIIDKFLSRFYDSQENSGKIVPILVADHLYHRQFALDHLLKYLENHGKYCILLLTLNTDEWPKSQDGLLQYYKNRILHLDHALNDVEISLLFEKVANDVPRVREIRDSLVDRAKSPEESNRDILFILFMWFDRQFRKLDDIILEETQKLKDNPPFLSLYLTVAIFHQYNFAPRISLCAEIAGLEIVAFTELRNAQLFKTFINIAVDNESSELASTRHAEFSRKILNTLLPDQEEQLQLMEQVLAHAGHRDIQFVRDFLNYVYRYVTFSNDQVVRLKEATESLLGKDYVLNHQFAAYLLRENVHLEHVRYYLDLALEEAPDNASIIHSLGHWCYRLYKTALDAGDIAKADDEFNRAKDFFVRSRVLTGTADEHAYYTDIEMTKYRIANAPDDNRIKVRLYAENQALTLEALRVIPFERQNLLSRLIGEGSPFSELSSGDQAIIREEVLGGKASPILLQYYANFLLERPKSKSWHRLRELAEIHKARMNDPAIATVVSLFCKRAFIETAATRFERLRTFFDKLVRYREEKMNYTLLAEYIRLIQIDALVLEKFDFLRSIVSDVTGLFREAKPRFLDDEFILDKRYYIFDETNYDLSLEYFILNSHDFNSQKKAHKYSKLVTLRPLGEEKYCLIQLDLVSKYFVRGRRSDIGLKQGKAELSFCVRYTYDGFMATDFGV